MKPTKTSVIILLLTLCQIMGEIIPLTPFVIPIPGGVYPGHLTRVQGTIAEDAYVFVVNFQCGRQMFPNEDIALHFCPRFETNQIARNSYNKTLSKKNWGREENDGGLPLKRGESFELLVLVESRGFKVALNGKEFCKFTHRVPIDRISHLTVEHDVTIQSITFEGTPPSWG